MVEIDISRAMKDLRKDLNDFQRHQVPFATALALTRIAQNVAEAERDAFKTVFDNPTPFTMKGVGVIAAKKSTLVATVYVKDVQSKYLEPSEKGGFQVLGGKRAILKPGAVKTNTYGNIPRGKLAKLKAQPNVFIGTVKFKSKGSVSGVWERPDRGLRRDGTRGTKGLTSHKSTKSGGIRERTGLRLLIEFADPAPIKPRLDFEGRARAVVDRTYKAEFDAAMDQALATAR